MKLSQFYLPLLKEDPQEATIVSHKLMLRAGMIKQNAQGIYTFLPLGYRVLRKIENIINTKAEYLISTDLSCLMHLEGRLKYNGNEVKILHLADVLASGY